MATAEHIDARQGGILCLGGFKQAARQLGSVTSNKIGVVLSAQHSNEDNYALAQLAKKAAVRVGSRKNRRFMIPLTCL